MNTVNSDLITIIKDLPQTSIELKTVTIDDRQFYEYKVNFLVDQIAAYAADVRSMRIDVAYKRVGKTFALLSGKSFASANDINNQLLNGKKIRSDFVKDRDKEQLDNTITTRHADIFARSRKVSRFRLQSSRFVDLAAIESTFESVAGLPSSQVSKIIASDLIKNGPPEDTSSNGVNIYTNLTLSGKDPAKQIVGASLVEDAEIARKGMVKAMQQKRSIGGAFTTATSQDNSNNRLPATLTVQKRQKVSTDVLLPHTFRLPTSLTPPNGKFSIICTVRKANGDLVQKIDFTINHARYLVKNSVPRQLPTVSVQFISKTSAQVNVFNKDPRVTGVRIYNRDIPTYQSVAEQAPFKVVGTLPTNWQQQVFTRKLPIKSTTNKIIRTVPVLTSGIVLGNFESKTHAVRDDLVAGAVVATANKGNVTINLYGSPASYKYVQFARRAVDKKQQQWASLQAPIKLGSGIASIEDLSVNAERTYEYAAFLQDTYGNIKRARTTSLVRVTDYTAGTEISVTQKSTSISGPSTTTTFSVAVKLTKDSDTTAILNATKEQGIDKYFDEETLKLSGDLSSITKVNVRRISLDTGEIKDLGVIEVGDFTDTTTENVVYVFEGLLRGQADLFEEVGSDKTSPRVFNPRDALQRSQIVSAGLSSKPQISKINFTQKFLSKKATLRGTLSYGNTKATDIDTSGFLQGRLGITETFSVNRSGGAININNFDLVTVDEGRRLITFDVISTTSQKFIDFFIISTIKGGVRSIVGACHYVDDNVRQNFLDDKTRLRSGQIAYVITPVRYDGTTLSETTTQQFEVV
jgi:hypothetical protein